MSSSASLRNQYLLLVAQEKFGYAVEELESIARCFDIDLTGKIVVESNASNLKTELEVCSPILILQSVTEDAVRKLLSRSVLVKDAYELWGVGGNLTELKASVSQYPLHLKSKWFDGNLAFAVRVKGVGKKVSLLQQISKIDSLEDVLLFQGKVDLASPDVEICVIEDYSERRNGQPLSDPSRAYLGRFLCNGQRKLIEHYSLKKRKFIGNTSMDSMLGMIMANFACVRPNSLTCDPFVGTGSLLISAAHYGSYVIGADINYNILHAQGKSSRKGAGWRQKDESIRDSLRAYGKEMYYVDALLCDAANHSWKLKSKELFDAIITDPPYGIREACSRLGSKHGVVVEIPDLPPGHVHYPEQKAYHLEDIFKDLLTFSARSLVLGGRLVYWLPVHRNAYNPDVIPTHPCLKLVYNCEQILNSHSSRRLIVMEKFKSVDVCNCDNNEASINSSVFSGHNAFRDKYFKV